MVNIQAFIASVQNLTGDGTSNELVHFCRKWFDENNDKLNFVEADRLLNQLVASQTSTSFTLAIVCCLFCKVTKVKTENELKDFLIGFDEVLPNFDVQQLHWAPDIYTRLLEFTTDLLIKKKVAIWGINLLKTSILIFTQGNSNWLTNIHPLLFCLCLKARYFDNIEPFLKIDVTQLLKQSYSAVSFQTNQQQQNQQIVTSTDNSNTSTTQQQQPPQSSTTTAPTNSSSLTSTAVSFLQKAVNTVSGTFGNPKSDVPCNKPTLQIVLFNRRSILLYFYYGALIYGALEKWEDSCLFLELLPSYRTPSLNRNYYHYALVYIRLPHLIEKALEAKKDLVVVLENFLNDKIAVFSKDQNVGLMKVLINVSRENALKRLENIFVSLQLNDVCRLAHLPSNINNDGSTITNVEQLILSLRLKNKINAQIDDLTQTVIFEEENNENKNEENIDEAMNEIIELSKVIRSFNDVIRLNPNFIEKGIQRSKSVGGGGCSTSMTVGGGGGNNGGGGASNLRNDGIFGGIISGNEDEGFYLGGGGGLGGSGSGGGGERGGGGGSP
uniref:COP9 signalosome complex subunit 3 n=1 Tax=Meloidogyne enterolobii TaxID=390850 RepID=A0A6V7UK73_MELEN|nr:unnamed protein product [Meloidogyne enterolobii]